MNDLNGLDGSRRPATGPKQSAQAQGQGTYSAFSSLRPTPPVSGRASPAVSAVPQARSAKASTTANDSFSNLVAFGGSGANASKKASLQEQQKRLEESKLQQLVGQKKQLQDQWAGNDDAWNNLGSGRSTPAVPVRNGTPKPAPAGADDEEDDLFAAFNRPPPPANTVKPTAHPPGQYQRDGAVDDDDDDPFGLSEFQARQKATSPANQSQPQPLADDDEDILGDLGKPVSERPPPKAAPRREPSPEGHPPSDHPQDRAVAELVDMGFPADKARRALEATDTGLNVQAAVGLLLNQAHEESRQKARGRDSAMPGDTLDEQPATRPRPRPSGAEQDHAHAARRDRSSTPSNEAAKTAQEFGAAFVKSAGAFWKTAQRSVQQAVSEFSSDNESGPSQPRWLREAGAPASRGRGDEPGPRRTRPSTQQQQQQQQQQQPTATDEALMLESERPTPPPRQAPWSRPDRSFDSSADTSRDHSPAVPSRLKESHSPQPAFIKQQQDPFASMMRPRAQPPPSSSRAALNRQAAEEQASQAYVSSARRRKPAPTAPAPAQQPQEEEEADLLGGSFSKPPPSHSAPSRAPRTTPSRAQPQPQPRAPPKPSTPIQTRPPPPTRSIPSIPALSLQASHAARLAGNESFKRGDYSSAHEAYSTSLRHIPASHPLQLILLTNRALTALKTGQAKLAITDADAAILLIGPGKGEGETVDLVDGESAPKPMKEYYGKALMRKAEALENLEKWDDAARVWKQCVEDGHGGATAIQSRARAERAAAPKPASVKKPPPRPPPTVRAAPPKPVSQKPAAAVSALRAQNQAAEKLDDEKFALADAVAARVNGWKGGKEGNLRALLASLDTVLWEGAGWKKIGMADLVLPGKVKVHYMKGIGKCHPDKIPTDATTEQRMIAGAVFSALNEAWDKFKAENNL